VNHHGVARQFARMIERDRVAEVIVIVRTHTGQTQVMASEGLRPCASAVRQVVERAGVPDRIDRDITQPMDERAKR
jgi:hypothetical protein